MNERSIAPVVGVSCCIKSTGNNQVHGVGLKYVTAALQGAGALPVLLPAVGEAMAARALLERLDGIMLTGSPSDIGPHHYGAEPANPAAARDPARDETTLPLIRAAIAMGLPILGICRGIQELNVALGGTLHQMVHRVPGRLDHRSDKTVPQAERYLPRHEVRLREGGLLQRIMGGRERIAVNSLHGQAVDRPAPDLAVEAVAEDGTIEALSLPTAKAFTLAVQWHPEWQVDAFADHARLLAAFGDACRARALPRMQDERLGSVA